MATIKIGDLLDLSSPLAASTCQGTERPRSGATVHHRPEGYKPEEAGRRRRERKPSGHVARIKVEREEEVQCPNVLVRNGVICTPYRREQEDRGAVSGPMHRRGEEVPRQERSLGVRNVRLEGGRCEGSEEEKQKEKETGKHYNKFLSKGKTIIFSATSLVRTDVQIFTL